MGNQKGALISGWDEASSQLKAWVVSWKLFLRDDRIHPAMCEMFLLLEETSGVSPRQREQDRQQHTLPPAVLRLIQQEFNKSFRQALERWQRLPWPNFENLQRYLVTGHLRTELVALTGGIAPPERPLPPPAAPCRHKSATQPAAGATPTPQ